MQVSLNLSEVIRATVRAVSLATVPPCARPVSAGPRVVCCVLTGLSGAVPDGFLAERVSAVHGVCGAVVVLRRTVSPNQFTLRVSTITRGSTANRPARPPSALSAPVATTHTACPGARMPACGWRSSLAAARRPWSPAKSSCRTTGSLPPTSERQP